MNWALIWMGTIALATVVLTTVQVVVLLRTAKLVKQAVDTAEELRREVGPLIAKAHRIADDAGRATSLALAQVERVDRLVTATADRIDDVVGAVHEAVVVPLKQGSVILNVLRGAMGLFTRGQRDAQTTNREDDDAMFVG